MPKQTSKPFIVFKGCDEALLIFGAFKGPFMETKNVARLPIAGLLTHCAGQQVGQRHDDYFGLLQRQLDGHNRARLIQEFETDFRPVIGNAARRQPPPWKFSRACTFALSRFYGIIRYIR
jgi:hypothetical protein